MKPGTQRPRGASGQVGERESGNVKSSCDVPSAFVGKMQVARGRVYTGR